MRSQAASPPTQHLRVFASSRDSDFRTRAHHLTPVCGEGAQFECCILAAQHQVQHFPADRRGNPAKGKGFQRIVTQFPPRQIEQQCCGQRPVDNQPAIVLLACSIVQVVVDPVAVESQRGIAEQQRLARQDRPVRLPVRGGELTLPSWSSSRTFILAGALDRTETTDFRNFLMYAKNGPRTFAGSVIVFTCPPSAYGRDLRPDG